MKKLHCFVLCVLGSTGLAMAKEMLLHLPELQTLSATATSLRVIYMPWSIATIKPVTPEQLMRLREYEFCNLSNDAQPRVVKEFVKAIGGTNFHKSSNYDVDCRWGFILSDRDSKTTVTIYFNAGLSEGLVSGQKFEPDKSFQQWVEQRFGVAFSLDKGH